MTTKRRAELQRKLSMGAVPRPPANLAERIKADIPNYLAPERTRFSLPLAMRVAASIILLMTTALVTLHLVEPGAENPTATTRRAAKVTPAVMRGTQEQINQAARAQASEEVRLDITQDIPTSAPAPVAPPPAAPVATSRRAEAPRPQSAEMAAAVEAEAVSGSSGGVMGAVADAAPAPPPAALPQPAEPVAVAEERVTVTAQAPMLAPTAPAAANTFRERAAEKSEAKQTVFGVSVDPAVFRGIRDSLEHGSRPTASRVDVDAVVNYFAGSTSPARPVALEVEASPAPVAADGDRAFLRFSVDTMRNGSNDAIARDARIDINIDTRAVESFRRIGAATSLTPESLLHTNVSVTGLYELQLKPRVKATQRIATVRLRYRSLANGREQTITRVIHGNDLAREWARASRRHRLATLGAVWGESLKGTDGGAVDVAKRAKELATQNPGDTRARELANAASASTGGGR